MENPAVTKILVNKPLSIGEIFKKKEELQNRIAFIVSSSEELVVEINDIKHQIDLAKAKVALGIEIDPIWLSKAQHAKRMKGSEYQKLQVERGLLNKELRRLSSIQCDNKLIKTFRQLVSNEIGAEQCEILFNTACRQAGQL